MYGHYSAPVRSDYENTLAELSRCCARGSEVEPDGVARVCGMMSHSAETALDKAVENGKAYKTEDGWYGPSESFCAEIAAKVAENERIDAENRKKYFSD